MWVIGLTGGIGSGKSTVAHWLLEQGIEVIDADRIVHELYEQDQEMIEAIVREFGREILTDSGRIDRKELGQRVFSDSKARTSLEQIIHPRVIKAMHKQQALLEAKGQNLCVWDVPLLFESDFNRFVHEIWVVWVPLEIQYDRVMKRDDLTLQEVKARIQAQYALEEKMKQADVVIDNSGTWEETQVQLLEELARIKREGLL